MQHKRDRQYTQYCQNRKLPVFDDCFSAKNIRTNCQNDIINCESTQGNHENPIRHFATFLIYILHEPGPYCCK